MSNISNIYYEIDGSSNIDDYPLYISMGTPIGEIISQRSNEKMFGVRIDGKQLLLDKDEFEIWKYSLISASLNTLLDWCNSHNIKNNENRIKDLIQTNLLLILTNTNKDYEILSKLRLIPFGISKQIYEENGFYVISSLELFNTLKIDTLGYLIWCYSDGYKSLKKVCETIIDNYPNLNLGLNQIFEHIFKYLPKYFLSRIAYLDLLY